MRPIASRNAGFGWARLFIFTIILATLGPVLPSQAQDLEAPAEYYGEETRVDLLEEETAGMEALAKVMTFTETEPLQIDPSLTLLARGLARQIQKDVTRQNQVLSSPLVNELKKRYAIHDGPTQTYSFIYASPAGVPGAILAMFPRGPVPYTHLGLGVARGGDGAANVAVVALTERRSELERFPLMVKPGEVLELEGTLVNTLAGGEADVIVTAPDGKVKKLETVRDGDRFGARIAFDQGPGHYRIEVMGRIENDPKIAALMLIHAGDGTGGRGAVFALHGFPAQAATEDEADKIVAAMVNQARQKEGLAALEPDSRLAALARDHALDMKQNGFVGHRSPTAGTFPERVAAAGLDDYLLLENVARDTSLVQAINNLLESPAHRAAILDPRVTHLGVAVVINRKNNGAEYFIAQEFAKF